MYLKVGESIFLKIVRNDITRMTIAAIVNTANVNVEVGPGFDLKPKYIIHTIRCGD